MANVDINLKFKKDDSVLRSIEDRLKNIKSIEKQGISISFDSKNQALKKLGEVEAIINRILGKKITLGFDNKLAENISLLKDSLSQIDKANFKPLISGINSLARVSGKVEEISTNISKLQKAMEMMNNTKLSSPIQDFTANLAKLAQVQKQSITTTRQSNEEFEKHGKTMLSITQYMARYAGAYTMFNVGKASLGELYDFEKAITQIGIAGEMSSVQVQQLRYDYTVLSNQTGVSAKDIANAGETIIKTGQSVGDTAYILNEAIRLSKATGDELSYTAESLSKILLTLQIDAKRVTEVTNMMMSVANKTPASMQSLQEGLKQANAGFANFAETTTKSGKALEDYRMTLIQTELAMMGGLSQLGRKGEQTGTSIRQLSTKMVTMEKTASNLFNTEMQLKKIFVEVDTVTGKLNITNTQTAKSFALTSDMLSTLAKEDAPKAIELLSKLYSNGQLSITTLNKMFTIQHAPYLTQVLTQVNGSLDEYNKKMTTGSTVTQAYDKAMESWANQFDKFKQAFSMSNALVSDFAKIMGSVLLQPVAEKATEFNKLYTEVDFFNTGLQALIKTIVEFGLTWKVVGTMFAESSILKASSFTMAIDSINNMRVAMRDVEVGMKEGKATSKLYAKGMSTLKYETQALGLAMKELAVSMAPMLIIFAGIEIFNLWSTSMEKQTDAMLKHADELNAQAKQMTDNMKMAKDYILQIDSAKKSTEQLRAESIYKDWNNINDVVDKVVGKFDKLKESQEAINKLTIMYATKTDYMAGVKELSRPKNVASAIMSGFPDTPEAEVINRISTENKIKLGGLYEQYIKTGKGLKAFKDTLKDSGLDIKDYASLVSTMISRNKEYTEQMAEATKQTQIFESNVKELLDIQKQNIKEFKFELIGDYINKADIKNVEDFTSTLKGFGLGEYANRLGNIKDAFKGIVTESGKVDVLRNNLLPLVSGLSFIDNLISGTNKLIEMTKKEEGQEQNVKDLQATIALLEEQKKRLIKNALIQQTSIVSRQETNKTYEIELLNLKKVGEGQLEQLQNDKKIFELNSKQQDKIDANELLTKRRELNKEILNQEKEFSDEDEKFVKKKLEELNIKAETSELTSDEVKAQKMILDYLNFEDSVNANKIKSKIQAQQYDIQELALIKQKVRIQDEYNDLMKTYSEVEHNNSLKMYEDWVDLSANKSKSLEAEEAKYKYLIQLTKERKAIFEDEKSVREASTESQNIKDLLYMLKLANDEEKARTEFAIKKRKIEDDIISLYKQQALPTTNSIDKAKIQNQIDQKKYESLEAYYELQLKIFNINENEIKYTNAISDERKKQQRLLSPISDFEEQILDIHTEQNRLISEQTRIKESDMNDAQKKVLLADNELKTEQSKTKELQLQLDLITKQIDLIPKTIDALTTGRVSTPKYDLSMVEKKMAGSLKSGHGYFGKANLNASDYGEIGNFLLTETSNVWATINKQQAENINHQIDMLEMQKQLSKTDEERQAIEKQILDKKIQAINLELQTQQQQAVMGGITQGTSAILASPTNPLSWLVGGLNVLSGIFGANQAEKQAERQKDALILQQRIAEATELTNKYMQINNKLINELYAGQSQGYEYALNKFYRQIKSEYSSMSGAGTISSDINSAFKESKNKAGLIKDTGNIWNTIFGQGTVSFKEGYGGVSLPQLKESNVTSYISSLESEVKSLNLNSDFNSVLDKINALSSLWGDFSKTGADANQLISAMNEATQSWKNYIYTLQNLSSKKDVFYSAYFGFKVEEIEDTAGNITDVIRGEWEKREDIMDKIVENAKTGANNIASYLGDYTIESILNSWTRNQSSLTNVITEIENDMYDLGTFMSENVNKSFTSLSNFSTYTNTAPSSKRPVYEEYNPIKNLVLDYQALSAQQDIINQQASNFLNIWVEAKGKVSDITGYMSDFSKNLYTAMQSALSQNTFIERFNTIGESLSNSITDKLKKNLMDNSLKNTFLNLNSEITKIMSGQETSISDVLTLRQQIEKATVQMTAESEKVRSISDLLNMSNDIQYSNTNQQIQYTSGTTSQITNNYANNITLDVSTLVTTSKEDRIAFANAFAGEILTAIEKKIGKIK